MLMNLETLDWDDELLVVLRHPARDAAGDPAVVRPGLLRHDAGERPGRRRGAAHRRPRRPAGGHRRAGLLRARRGQEHLRHRQLPAAQHRHRAGPLQERAAHDRLLPVRRPRRRCTRWRARSRSPGRPCSGCATSSASSPAPRRARRWPGRSRTTAACTSCPAFSGLFAPYWRSDARGAIVGLSRFNTNAHLARATLESICYQTRDVVEAMRQDSGVTLDVLRVDGGVTANELCMQLQADILGVPVSKPVVAETTALGAAYAAGLATGFWQTTDELRRTGTRTSAGSRAGATSSAPAATPAGRRRSSAPSTGSTSTDRPIAGGRAAPAHRAPRPRSRLVP